MLGKYSNGSPLSITQLQTECNKATRLETATKQLRQWLL